MFSVHFVYLAGEDVAKSRESVVQSFVVDRLVEVLDEHVAHAGLPGGGVSLRPHDSDWLPFDHVKVHGVQGSLSWGGEGDAEVEGKGRECVYRRSHESENTPVTTAKKKSIYFYIRASQHEPLSPFTPEMIVFILSTRNKLTIALIRAKT